MLLPRTKQQCDISACAFIRQNRNKRTRLAINNRRRKGSWKGGSLWLLLMVTDSSQLTHICRFQMFNFFKNSSGIYFSAQWCPPCQNFTPLLAECYKKVKDAGKKLEIIFISLDKDEEACREYHKCMPWLRFPFESDLKVSL